MQRIPTQPRENWPAIVESQGFHFHSIDDEPYWDESVRYEFAADEIDAIERATYALNDMTLAAAQRVIDEDLWARFQIPVAFAEFVKRSWDRDELTIYGRFDLAFDGEDFPKLLEYNADTPTSLLEAAVIQWQWMKDVFAGAPGVDQFNSIHEKLIDAWKAFAEDPRSRSIDTDANVYFSSLSGHLEDFMTVNYLRDTAMQAGLATAYIEVERIGFNAERRVFVDEREQHLAACFKLYPWEWMTREKFAPNLVLDNTWWLESPWKMILSNKAILPVLHEMFPDSPYLLPARVDAPDPAWGSYVRKPLLSREGANVSVVIDGNTVVETEGIYGGGPYVFQQYRQLPEFDGNYPVIGSWLVNGHACGIGIREDVSPVTGNFSRFVPHIFKR
jgi:glutathionylspermidine synthase